MSWLVVLSIGIGSYVLRTAGLTLIAERESPEWALALLRLVPIAILPALIAVQTLGGSANPFLIDARLPGVAAAVVAVLLRASFLVAVTVAVAVTASVRLLGWG